MPDPLPQHSLVRAREQKIEELSQHFANDDLSLDDLERRIERVYKAVTLSDLEQITADLRMVPVVDPRAPGLAPGVQDPQRGALAYPDPSAPVTPAYNTTGITPPETRLVAVMSSTKRVGRWAVPRNLRVFALMSETKLDLTQALVPVGGVVEMHIDAIMANVRLTVPPGIRVINELHSFMSDVASAADELETPGLTRPGTPLIRITGTAVMSEVKVKVV